jgi:hypothetical protein
MKIAHLTTTILCLPRFKVRLRKHNGEHSPYMPTEICSADGEYIKVSHLLKLIAATEGKKI